MYIKRTQDLPLSEYKESGVDWEPRKPERERKRNRQNNTIKQTEGRKDMKYFKNVKSYEDLKKQFKALLKANHPDNGGDAEIMKEINVEYDALFPIWKNRHETQTGETINETSTITEIF